MEEKQYKAFISYSHKDERFAKWLHQQLEKYKIPKELRKDYPNLPKSLFPIFRDREELHTSANLGIEILKALKNSEYLIIICSINSAKSQWVNQEIIDFKSIHGEDKIRAIILDGEPHAIDNDKFSDDLECFPEALKYEVIDGKLSNVPTEPIAGDFRKGKDGKEQGKLKLISGLLGVGFDELNHREEKIKRQTWFIWGTFTTIFISIISSFLVYIYMIESSLIDVESEISKLKLYIKSVDSQENNKTMIVLNKKLKVLLKIKREKEEILDKFGFLDKEEQEVVKKVLEPTKDDFNYQEIEFREKNISNNQIEQKIYWKEQYQDHPNLVSKAENVIKKREINKSKVNHNLINNEELNLESEEVISSILEIKPLESCNIIPIDKLVEAKNLLDSSHIYLNEEYIQISKEIIQKYQSLIEQFYRCQEINELVIYSQKEYGKNSPYTHMYIEYRNECRILYTDRLKAKKNICYSLKKLVPLTKSYINKSEKQEEIIPFLKSFLSILNEILSKHQNTSINIVSDSLGRPIDEGL